MDEDDGAEQQYIPDDPIDHATGFQYGGYNTPRSYSRERLNKMMSRGGRGCFIGMTLPSLLPATILGLAWLAR